MGSWVEKQTWDSSLDSIKAREGEVEPERQRGGRGSEAWPAAACPRQETPRCFLCPVAATRGLAPAEPNACVCFCGAVHTWGRVDFLRQKLRGDLHLNGDILT